MTKNPKFDEHQWGFASIASKSFDKMYSGAIESKVISNQELAKE